LAFLEGCPIVTPQTVLVVSGRFGEPLGAEDVARAIGRGLVAGGLPPPDLCPIEQVLPIDFDVQMKRARAVVVVERRLNPRMLRDSVMFEIATRARQGGVPTYAVTAKDALDLFDARILDLQAILRADNKRALVAAGRKLATLI
jgi:glycerate kinase